MEPRSQGHLVRVGGNRDLGRRGIPTGEEQREKEREILQLSLTKLTLKAREPGKCSSLSCRAGRSGRGPSPTSPDRRSGDW